MSSSVLRVVVAHRPPFVFAVNASNGQNSYSGMLIDLLYKILVESNNTFQTELYLSPTNSGGSYSGGVWNGVVGELVANRADVALFPLTRTAARLSAIDCTFSYLDQGLSLLVREDVDGPGPLSVLAPFQMTLWVTLLCTVIGVALIFWALDAYGKWIRARQTDALRSSGVISERTAARARKDDHSHVMVSFMAVAGAPERPMRASWGVQVLYVVYCFFCLIVLSAYTANLTSFLAVQRASQGVSGLQDLVRGQLQLGVNPNGSTATYFTNSQDTLAIQLQNQIKYCDTTTCVSLLRAGGIAGFVSDQPALAYLAQQQPCDLSVVGDPFGPGNLVIGLQQGSALLPAFNAAIQRFAEDGTLTALHRAWFDGLSQCDNSGAQLDNSRLGVQQMLGAFVFLLMGVVVAFSTGTVENLKWCLAKAYSPQQEHASRQGPLRQRVRMLAQFLTTLQVDTHKPMTTATATATSTTARGRAFSDPGYAPDGSAAGDTRASWPPMRSGKVTAASPGGLDAAAAVAAFEGLQSADQPGANANGHGSGVAAGREVGKDAVDVFSAAAAAYGAAPQVVADAEAPGVGSSEPQACRHCGSWRGSAGYACATGQLPLTPAQQSACLTTQQDFQGSRCQVQLQEQARRGSPHGSPSEQRASHRGLAAGSSSHVRSGSGTLTQLPPPLPPCPPLQPRVVVEGNVAATPFWQSDSGSDDSRVSASAALEVKDGGADTEVHCAPPGALDSRFRDKWPVES